MAAHSVRGDGQAVLPLRIYGGAKAPTSNTEWIGEHGGYLETRVQIDGREVRFRVGVLPAERAPSVQADRKALYRGVLVAVDVHLP